MKRFLFLFSILFSVVTYGQKKVYTSKQAIEYVHDYFSFYEADKAYENPEARKVSDSVFHIKVNVCLCVGGKENCYKMEAFYDGKKAVSFKVKNEVCWHSKIYILTIKENGRYEMKEKSPWAF